MKKSRLFTKRSLTTHITFIAAGLLVCGIGTTTEASIEPLTSLDQVALTVNTGDASLTIAAGGLGQGQYVDEVALVNFGVDHLSTRNVLGVGAPLIIDLSAFTSVSGSLDWLLEFPSLRGSSQLFENGDVAVFTFDGVAKTVDYSGAGALIHVEGSSGSGGWQYAPIALVPETRVFGLMTAYLGLGLGCCIMRTSRRNYV